MMLQFSDQCCDADGYLELGQRCAELGQCYDSLRPLGSVLWFAWPCALGLPSEILIVAHAVLALLSIGLCARAALRWIDHGASGALAARRPMVRAAIVLSSALAHGVFLLPTSLNSLADPPAALLCLIAVWLLLLASPDRLLPLLLAGLALGSAAWVRAFYLYPVLGLLALYCLLWARRRERSWRQLAVLAALIPIGIQFIATYRDSGEFSFIGAAQTAQWKDVHLSDGSAGYDTLLPLEPFRWLSHCDPADAGVAQALQRRDAALALCVLAARINFYLGSYAAATYLKAAQLDVGYFDQASILSSTMIDSGMQFNAAPSPDGRHAAVLFTARATNVDSIAQGMDLRFATQQSARYVFSLWIWSPTAGEVEMQFIDPADRRVIASQHIALSSKPMRHHVSAEFVQGKTYALFVGRPAGSSARWGATAGDSLYVWGGTLVLGETPAPWVARTDARQGEAQRGWSPALLAAHLAALAVVAIGAARRRFTLDHRHASVLVLMGLLFAQSLIIVPEQRFIIVPQVVLWIAASVFIIEWLSHRRRASIAAATSKSGHVWTPPV